MKVLCIDAKKVAWSNNDTDIVEGEIYTVTDSWVGNYSNQLNYSLAEFHCIRGQRGFLQRRFTPLSTIDETELLEQRQNQLNPVL